MPSDPPRGTEVHPPQFHKIQWETLIRHISAIKSSDDQVTTNPVAINYIFKGFYTNLHKAETDFDEPICKQYLDKLELPRISQMDKESLEAPLSMEELHVRGLRGTVF